MDSLVAAAARALAEGDVLRALNCVALREDPPALAMRGIAMARVGEYRHARELLQRAARAFGANEPLAHARCVVADAEVALAMRDVGTAFDGTHLYQITESRIDRIDPATGKVVASIPAPGHGTDSGLAWAEGSLWVGQYRDRKIHRIDPATGKVLRTIVSDRFVTGVTWVDGELWHGTWEGDESDVRRIDARTGDVLERLKMPEGIAVSGLESNGGDLLYCGGGGSGKVRAVRRTKGGQA